MKKTTLTTFIFFTLLVLVKAQIQEGTYTMRPSVYFSHSPQNKTNDFSIGASYGRVIQNQLLLTGGVSGDWLENSFWKNYSTNINLHYYYLPESKLNPYIFTGLNYSAFTILSNLTYSVQGSIFNSGRNVTNGVITSGSINDTTSRKYTLQQLDASIGTGVQYFVNENIALDARLNFTVLGVRKKTQKILYCKNIHCICDRFIRQVLTKQLKKSKTFTIEEKRKFLEV